MAARTDFATPLVAVSRRSTRTRQVARAARDDFAKFAYDGWGVMLTDQQLEARETIGPFGPRNEDDPKTTYLSGGQRAGKTVLLGLQHADGGMYKRGVDNTDPRFWRNYLYKTLAIAPTTELAMRLWVVMDELAKGASDAQYDRRVRRARGGAFIGMMRAAKLDKWPVVFYDFNAQTDFRSSEGRAFRLEGGQWWGASWDEWASQPDWEIPFVLDDVLLGRTRDHDAKIICAAWPKPETEHHLISVIRELERGDPRAVGVKRVVYLSAAEAHFTNQQALQLERGQKDEARWTRTVLGRPAGGASKDFPADVVANAVEDDLPMPLERDPAIDKEFLFFTSWDLGLGQDSTVGYTWAIPRVGVSPETPAQIANMREVRGSASLTIDDIVAAVAEEQETYDGSSAVDATSMGGLAVVRQLRDLTPRPLAFTSRSNDRTYGNMRNAALANALELLTWGRRRDPETGEVLNDEDEPWGVVVMPRIQALIDQLATFDKDATKSKAAADDHVAAFVIGLWYIRRFWLLSLDSTREHVFDGRMMGRKYSRFHR